MELRLRLLLALDRPEIDMVVSRSENTFTTWTILQREQSYSAACGCYVSCSASATLERAARIAGKMPPSNPSVQASKIAVTTKEGVMVNE
jgi:hypothetical protein